MSPYVAAKVARLSRRSLCSAVALALSLMCILLAVAASTTPMADQAEAAVAAPGVAGEERTAGPTDAAAGAVVHQAVASVVWGMPPAMDSSCEDLCLTGAGAVCAAATGLAANTLLALFLASRRNTFTGMLKRAPDRVLPRRRQRPWLALSPISLCVLRV